ncbi:MAG: ribosome assembly factor SBDS [Zestosphaera sp.]
MSKEYVIARLEKSGSRFEILVNPEKALKYKEGELGDVAEVLVGDIVYKNVKKGDKASPQDLIRAFGTTDVRVVADTILKKGELQLTTDQRRGLIEQKKRLIVSYIAKSVVDPKTKTPIPPQRIEKAMDEARISVDLYKTVEEQASKIVKELVRVLPIKVAKALITIKVPPAIAGRAYSELKKLGEVKNERWLSDGALYMEVEIPAGMQNEVIDSINRVTKGDVELSVKVM